MITLERSQRSRWAKCALVLITPLFDDYRFVYAPECRPGPVWADCIGPALAEAQMDIRQARSTFVSCGPAGIAQAIALASEQIRSGELDRVVLLAFDSLLDSRSLAALSETHRLKCDENPVGLAPGEAACALLLEGLGQRQPLATVAQCVFEPDGPLYIDPEARCNRGFNRTLREVLRMREPKAPFRGDVIVNLNGEEWRAAAFGSAIASLPAGTLAEYQLVPPAVSLGDTGAASGAIAVGLATRALERGYSSAGDTVVLALSEAGEAGALLLRRGAHGD